MPLEWLLLYQEYTATYGLPNWRQEIQLARIAMSIDALRFPNAKLSMENYMIRPQGASVALPQEDSQPSQEEADAICAALGFLGPG